MKENLRNDISLLAQQIIELSILKSKKISFAESMTGGLLASSLTNESNASKIFEKSYIVYSDEAKIETLNVEKKTIKDYSVYSFETIEEMLDGLKEKTKSDILVAVSGIAGPNPDNNRKVGEVYIGIMIGERIELFLKHFEGDREMVRLETVKFCFDYITKYLKNI